MTTDSKDSFNSLADLTVDKRIYKIFSLKKAEKSGLEGISRLPKSLKVLLENLLRFQDNQTIKEDQIQAFKKWLNNKSSKTEIAFKPARVLMQDYTGIPAVADLAAMRDCCNVKEKKSKQNKSFVNS
jgi:aconitate hydratase